MPFLIFSFIFIIGALLDHWLWRGIEE